MRILIIEDNKSLAIGLKKRLEQEGYAADCLFDGETGEKRIQFHHIDYSVIILDIMLPKKDGLEIVKSM